MESHRELLVREFIEDTARALAACLPSCSSPQQRVALQAQGTPPRAGWGQPLQRDRFPHSCQGLSESQLGS